MFSWWSQKMGHFHVSLVPNPPIPCCQGNSRLTGKGHVPLLPDGSATSIGAIQCVIHIFGIRWWFPINFPLKSSMETNHFYLLFHDVTVKNVAPQLRRILILYETRGSLKHPHCTPCIFMALNASGSKSSLCSAGAGCALVDLLPKDTKNIMI